MPILLQLVDVVTSTSSNTVIMSCPRRLLRKVDWAENVCFGFFVRMRAVQHLVSVGNIQKTSTLLLRQGTNSFSGRLRPRFSQWSTNKKRKKKQTRAEQIDSRWTTHDWPLLKALWPSDWGLAIWSVYARTLSEKTSVEALRAKRLAFFRVCSFFSSSWSTFVPFCSLLLFFQNEKKKKTSNIED